MKNENSLLVQSIEHLKNLINQKRKWQMPGDGRYQPVELKPYLGYDQWAGILIIVEWFWLLTLFKIGVMPKKDTFWLKHIYLFEMLDKIITSKQDKVERKTKHDIIALLVLMKKILPKPLHRWLHYCATSYDIINTAYALQIKLFFTKVFWPELQSLDEKWRNLILKYARTLQMGRTHLQHALPITVGFWQSGLHNRMVNSARRTYQLSLEVPGKFTGAVGTSASQVVLIGNTRGEKILMDLLGLPCAEVTTQITPPEATARFYSEVAILSGALANVGEDVRILQAPEFGEIISASSSSSAMSHKEANPITAENISGMHISVIAESFKVMLTLVSDLQRDLRWSNVMRSFSAAAVYNFQQIQNTRKLLDTFKVNEQNCQRNFNITGKLVVAELLHLYLQSQDIPEAHEFVNKIVIPQAKSNKLYLSEQMDIYAVDSPRKKINKIWKQIPSHILYMLNHPEEYVGKAVEIAEKEAKNKL